MIGLYSILSLDLPREARLLPFSMKDTIKEAIAELVVDTVRTLFIALANTSYIITLLGGTICIILYVAGWEKGMKWMGILFVTHILITAIVWSVM